MLVSHSFCSALIAAIVRLSNVDGFAAIKKVHESIATCSDCEELYGISVKDMNREAKKLIEQGRLAHVGVEVRGNSYFLTNAKKGCANE